MIQRMRPFMAGFALALAVLASASTPVRAVDGCQGSAGSVTYYYGSSKSDVVGQYTAPCDGSPCTGGGQITSSYSVKPLFCLPPSGDS